ncbi:MAG: trigger factor [Longimicrobiales bacterium]
MTVEPADLKVEIEKSAAWTRRLTITVTKERVARERSSAAKRISQKVRLPGFRKGKVPMTVLEKRFGQAIEQEAIERLIGDAYREAVKQEGLRPITQGEVDRVDYSQGSDLTFAVDLEVRPEIELERLGGFAVKREVGAVTSDQVQQVLERLREQNAVLRPLEDAQPAEGDVVTVEIQRKNDEAGASPRAYQLTLGQNQALPRIEALIRTLKPGTEGDFDVDLPANPDEPEGATERHELHIHLLDAKHPERPELDDEFARSIGEFDDLATLRERIRTDLEREAGREADRDVRYRLMQNILEANRFEVPASMVEDYLRQLLPDREDADKEKIELIRQQTRPAATDLIRRHLAIERIAETESLRASPAEVDEKLERVAQAVGKNIGHVRAQFQKNGRLSEIENEITEDKVFDYLFTLSTIE